MFCSQTRGKSHNRIDPHFPSFEKASIQIKQNKPAPKINKIQSDKAQSPCLSAITYSWGNSSNAKCVAIFNEKGIYSYLFVKHFSFFFFSFLFLFQKGLWPQEAARNCLCLIEQTKCYQDGMWYLAWQSFLYRVGKLLKKPCIF